MSSQHIYTCKPNYQRPFCSSTYGIFMKTNYELHHTENLNKEQQKALYVHKGGKLKSTAPPNDVEISKQKKHHHYQHTHTHTHTHTHF